MDATGGEILFEIFNQGFIREIEVNNKGAYSSEGEAIAVFGFFGCGKKYTPSVQIISVELLKLVFDNSKRFAFVLLQIFLLVKGYLHEILKEVILCLGEKNLKP